MPSKLTPRVVDIVAVGLDREIGGLKQSAMVFPGRVADVNGGIGYQAFQIVSADFQGPGTADGLSRYDALVTQELGIMAEEQCLHGLVIGGRTFDRLVTARRRIFHAGFFSGTDSLEKGQFALIIVVDTNA